MAARTARASSSRNPTRLDASTRRAPPHPDRPGLDADPGRLASILAGSETPRSMRMHAPASDKWKERRMAKPKVAMVLANNFEDSEAIDPKNHLESLGAEVVTIAP